MDQVTTAGPKPGLSDDAFALLQDIVGRKGALTVVDMLDDDAALRYRSFFPVGEMLIGLRFHENDPSRLGMRNGNIACTTGDTKRDMVMLSWKLCTCSPSKWLCSKARW